ncbi:MAG: hypothetical protein IIA87_01470 [Nanoarchaeota archaeon]|nr:hypothetical protein [Nanoarchaeota archaeon]
MTLNSDYICNCGKFLYVDGKDSEYCLDRDCKNHKDLSLLRDRTEEAEKAFNQKMAKIKIKASLFSRNLLNFLFTRQDLLLSGLLIEGKMQIEDYLYISFLINLLSGSNLTGRESRIDKMDKFLEEGHEIYLAYMFFQDMLEKNYVLAETSSKKMNPLRLKYLEEMNRQKLEYGLVTEKTKDDAFFYEDLNFRSLGNIEFELGMDLEKYFQRFFQLMIQIGLLTKTNYYISKIYNREFSKYSICGLLSLFFSAKTFNSLNRISKKELRLVLEKMDFSEEEVKKFFKFLLGGSNQIPFALEDGDDIVYGKSNLFIIALKFMGVLPELSMIVKGKISAGLVFEEKVRAVLKKKGYIVPFKNGFKLFKESLEYDLIAISIADKKIVVGESKYHDLPPSGFSAKNLAKIKLEDPNSGEKGICSRQKERGREISNNLKRLQEKCKEKGINIELKEFEVVPIAVFKFTPLLKEYDCVRTTSFKKLENFEI